MFSLRRKYAVPILSMIIPADTQCIIGRVGRRSADDTPSHVSRRIYSDPWKQRRNSVRCYYFFSHLPSSHHTATHSAAGATFSNLLRQNMAKLAPNLPAQLVAAVEENISIIKELDPSVQSIVVEAYTESISKMFFICIAAGGLGCLSAM